MKNGWKLVSVLALGVSVWLSLAVVLQARDVENRKAAAAFEKLKALQGRWEASMGEHRVVATYEVVSNGTAVLERVDGHGVGGMITLYYLEGDHLALTHYCMQGNQPHMTARIGDADSNELHFQLSGTLGLGDAAEKHMDEVLIHFDGPGRVTQNWTEKENGQFGHVVTLSYRRIS